MKKTIYTLGSLLLVCLVGLVFLFAGRLGDQSELKTLQTRNDELVLELVAIEKEKTVWEGEKARVAQGLVSVRQILNNTLIDLEEVTDYIGVDLIANSPQESLALESSLPPSSAFPPSTLKPDMDVLTSPLTNTERPPESQKPIQKVEEVTSSPQPSAAEKLLPASSKPSDSPSLSQKEE